MLVIINLKIRLSLCSIIFDLLFINWKQCVIMCQHKIV